ncbi:RAMP superfamily CRISPR-associated protein [Phormidesmis priestleyi]
MTRTPPPKPQKPHSTPDEFVPKPYELISFPKQPPILQRPIGHHKYFPDRLHGSLTLTLKVQTALHVSTGIAVMGSDIGSRVPLIKTMVQDIHRSLSIQGSSLKGCIRSVYEAITNSTLAVVTSRRDKSEIPDGRSPCRNKKRLCPASRVFGALDWQGLIEFSDANCETAGYATGFMPAMYRPRPDQRQAYFMQGKVAGRKFYYHAVRSIEPGQNTGIAVQQAGREYTFSTQLQFKNLKPEELGTLLIVLGQDKNYPIALKVGGGKPIGMGTMTMTVNSIDLIEGAQSFRNRYLEYSAQSSNRLTGEALRSFMNQKIQMAHTTLVEKIQLEHLAQVLRYPTDREPPSGMY